MFSKLFVTLFLANCLALSAPPPTLTYENPVSSVVLIQPSNAEFSKTLKDSVDPKSLETLRAILPFAILVRNHDTRPVIAVVAVYRLKNSSGEGITQQFTIHTLDLDPDRALMPGEAAFLAPMTSICRKLGPGRHIALSR